LVDQEFGLTFLDCRLIREKQVPPNSVSLGRAWRPTTTFPDGRYGNPRAVGQSVFVRCWMDKHIEIAGWDAMTYGTRDGSRVRFEPADARFYEFDSRGPGAIANAARRKLSAEGARRFQIQKILGEWRP
jgi:pectinesterase